MSNGALVGDDDGVPPSPHPVRGAMTARDAAVPTDARVRIWVANTEATHGIRAPRIFNSVSVPGP